ncbi:glycosyltransferase, partial [Streptococcus pyogenes]
MQNGNNFKSYWLKYAIKPFLGNVVWHSTAQQEKDEILRVFPKAKVEIIPNGIELSKFKSGNLCSSSEYTSRFLNMEIDAGKIIVSMGRIQKKKGFDILIKSFLDVTAKYPTAKLLIAGEDEGE